MYLACASLTRNQAKENSWKSHRFLMLLRHHGSHHREGLQMMDQAAPAQRAYVVSTTMPQPLRESASRRGRPRAHAASVLHTQAGTGASAMAFLAPTRACPATPVSGEPLSTAYPAGRACRPGLCGAWRPGDCGPAQYHLAQQLIQADVAGARASDQCAPEDRGWALPAGQLGAPWLGNRHPGAPAVAVGAVADGGGAWCAGLSCRA